MFNVEQWAHEKADELRTQLPEGTGYGLVVFAFRDGIDAPVHLVSDACPIDVIAALRTMANDMEARLTDLMLQAGDEHGVQIN